jgi:uncharacterized protein YabE (DUF348 family)
VPGQHDVWTYVTSSLLGRARARFRPAPTTSDGPTPSPDSPLDGSGPQRPGLEPLASSAPGAPSLVLVADEQPPSPARRVRRPRRVLPVVAATLAIMLAGGGVAVARAQKTVTVDVDGRLTTLSTFSGSVAGVLEAEDITVGGRDALTPAADTGLADGDEIVVRHARRVTVLVDGEQTTVWTTALSVDEALGTLTARGRDVRLLASRSAAGRRADLPLQLAVRGQVDVVADGQTRTVAAAQGLEDALASLDLTVGELDRVSVTRAEGGRLQVVLQRVAVGEQPQVTPIPFETTTEETDELYKGQQREARAGVDGELTTTYRITTVDGVEESRETLSEVVTREPVARVVRVGTKARPAPVSGTVVTGDVWGALAKCESGGNPLAVSSNGLYYGLYQFSLSTWRAMGGSGLPTEASAAEQTQRAQALQARSGWGQWPACAAKLGLL